MALRVVLAWLHLLALVVGVAGVWARGRALRHSAYAAEESGAVRRALAADAWWGVAALVWIATGLWRLLAGTEKATNYYTSNTVFLAKMGLFLCVVALELWPMRTLMRWRRGTGQPNAHDVGRIEVISYIECALVLVIALAAVTMARGGGMMTAPAVRDSVIAPPVIEPVVDTDPVALAPSGVETVTDDDRLLLIRELAMPLDALDPAGLKSSFNDRRGGGTRPHEALDMMAKRGTPVKAAAKGRVLKLFNSKAGGLMVYATDSSERFIMLYGHLNGYAHGLHDGAALSRGQIIGYVGSTGNASATAPHLHFAIARSADVKRWSKGAPIDPLPLLQAATRSK